MLLNDTRLCRRESLFEDIWKRRRTYRVSVKFKCSCLSLGTNIIESFLRKASLEDESFIVVFEDSTSSLKVGSVLERRSTGWIVDQDN